MNCINTNSQEFKNLVKETNKSSFNLEISINSWQEEFHTNPKEVQEKVFEPIKSFFKQFGIDLQDRIDLGSELIINLPEKIAKIDTNSIEEISKTTSEYLGEMLSYSSYFYEVQKELKGTKYYENRLKELGSRSINNKRQATKEIFKQLIENGFNHKFAKQFNINKSLLQKIKDFIYNLVTKLQGVNWTNINRQIDDIVEQTLKGKDFIRLTKKEGFQKVEFQEAFDKNQLAKDILTKIGANENIILTGSIAFSTQGTVYRKINNLLHDLDFVSFNTPEENDKLLKDNFPDAIEAYKFSSGYNSIEVSTYIIPPVGYKIDNIKRAEGRQKIVHYDVINKETNKIEGTFDLKYEISSSKKISNEEEIKNGKEAIYLDFFTGERKESRKTINQEFINSNNNKQTVKLAHYESPFSAKLQFSRMKDIWDYNRFIPNSFNNKNIKDFPTREQLERFEGNRPNNKDRLILESLDWNTYKDKILAKDNTMTEEIWNSLDEETKNNIILCL